jgi:nicotinamide-nucleotide amidase
MMSTQAVAEVISIGDELTSGQRLDTNSRWLSQMLSDLGILVQAHQTIGDYLEPMCDAFRHAAGRADVVIVTGGLGPTQDDLTRQALAAAFAAQLDFDPAIWQQIQALFARRQMVAPENNRWQAMFPRGSEPIPNPHGTAPGIFWSLQPSSTQTRQVYFFCLPGVPMEMREMVADWVQPRLRQLYRDRAQVIVRRVIKTFGAGESQVESQLPDLIKRGNDPQVGITASQATISLRLQASAATPEAAEEKLRPVIETIHQCLGSLVYGHGDDELEDVVVTRLQQQPSRLVVVEWGTRGLVSQRLDEAEARRPLSSSGGPCHYSGSVILTHLDAVRRWLAPDVLVPSEIQATDPNLIRWMARVAADRFQADLVLASGPLPAAVAAASETPCFHVLARYGQGAAAREFPQAFTVLGHPDLWRPRAAKQMLNHLRLRWLAGDFS